MRHLIAPLTSTLTLALALVAAPALTFSPSLQAEEKKEEHKHKDGEKHEHGDEKPLGEITLNGATFTVFLEGAVKAGTEIEIKLVPKGELPKGTLRGWIGSDSGKGSVKGKAHAEEGAQCIHAEVPDPIPADAKVWVEIDHDGTKAKAGLGLPK